MTTTCLQILRWYVSEDSTFAEEAAKTWNAATHQMYERMTRLQDFPFLDVLRPETPHLQHCVHIMAREPLVPDFGITMLNYTIKKWNRGLGKDVRKMYRTRSTHMLEYIDYLIYDMKMSVDLLAPVRDVIAKMSHKQWNSIVRSVV